MPRVARASCYLDTRCNQHELLSSMNSSSLCFLDTFWGLPRLSQWSRKTQRWVRCIFPYTPFMIQFGSDQASLGGSHDSAATKFTQNPSPNSEIISTISTHTHSHRTCFCVCLWNRSIKSRWYFLLGLVFFGRRNSQLRTLWMTAKTMNKTFILRSPKEEPSEETLRYCKFWSIIRNSISVILHFSFMTLFSYYFKTFSRFFFPFVALTCPTNGIFTDWFGSVLHKNQLYKNKCRKHSSGRWNRFLF